MNEAAVFTCARCGFDTPQQGAELDEHNRLVCGECYLNNPPQADIDAAVDNVEERLRRDHWNEMVRAHNREMTGVCDTCGGRTSDGRCGHGCR